MVTPLAPRADHCGDLVMGDPSVDEDGVAIGDPIEFACSVFKSKPKLVAISAIEANGRLRVRAIVLAGSPRSINPRSLCLSTAVQARSFLLRARRTAIFFSLASF